MFFTNLMVGTHNRAFEKAPDVLNGVGVNITLHPFIGTMVDRFMLDTLFLKPFISWKVIGKDSFYFGSMLLDKLQQGRASKFYI